MDVTLAIMWTCLAIGVIVAVIGLVQLARSARQMYNVVTSLQVELQSQVELLVAKQDEILVRLDAIQANQEELALNLERLETAYGRLAYIAGEMGEAASLLKPLEPLSFVNGRWAEVASVLRRMR